MVRSASWEKRPDWRDQGWPAEGCDLRAGVQRISLGRGLGENLRRLGAEPEEGEGGGGEGEGGEGEEEEEKS